MPVGLKHRTSLSSLEGGTAPHQMVFWRLWRDTAGLDRLKLCLSSMLPGMITPVGPIWLTREAIMWGIENQEIFLLYHCIVLYIYQVLLVTGGHNMNEGWLDSTEILENLAATWRFTSPLPSARYGLRAASVGNNILVFGENILFYIVIKHRSMTIYL